MKTKKVKKCHFCINNLDVDYKDVRTLRRFINFYMKILPGKRTGVCAWHQRKLAIAIKRARVMALLPATHK
jgi:small subunit ribosomal protein S18